MYCGNNDVFDMGRTVWCGCLMSAPRDKHQNAHCWKVIDRQAEEIKELVDGYFKLKIFLESCYGNSVFPSDFLELIVKHSKAEKREGV
jgi:hypothetical protein